jgi:hypothetical protein
MEWEPEQVLRFVKEFDPAGKLSIEWMRHDFAYEDASDWSRLGTAPETALKHRQNGIMKAPDDDFLEVFELSLDEALEWAKIGCDSCWLEWGLTIKEAKAFQLQGITQAPEIEFRNVFNFNFHQALAWQKYLDLHPEEQFDFYEGYARSELGLWMSWQISPDLMESFRGKGIEPPGEYFLKKFSLEDALAWDQTNLEEWEIDRYLECGFNENESNSFKIRLIESLSKSCPDLVNCAGFLHMTEDQILKKLYDFCFDEILPELIEQNVVIDLELVLSKFAPHFHGWKRV